MTEQVLVFGAKGYIGRVVSRLLEINPDFDPVRVYRESDKQILYLQGSKFEFENLKSLGAHLGRHARVKFAINAAAQTHKGSSHEEIQQLVEANVNYTSHIAKLCADTGVERLVHFGTFSTSVDGLNVDPQTFYAATKAASYEVLRYFALREGLQVIVIELFDVYAKDHPHGKVISRLMQALSSGQGMTLSYGEQELAPVHALDVAEAAINARGIAVSDALSIWSLPGPQIFTLRDLATEIAVATGQERALDSLRFIESYRTNEIMVASPRHKVFPLQNKIRIKDGLDIAALI